MFELVNSFLSNLTAESAVILGTGLAGFAVAVGTSISGARKGKPTPEAMQFTMAELAKSSCGAPAMSNAMREMVADNRRALDRQDTIVRNQDSMMRDVEKVKVDIAVLVALVQALGR